MPRITKPLCETEVKHAKPKGTTYNLADGKGLYLKIKPSGYKVWIFNYYRPFTKKRTVDTLGEYPVITLAKARSRRNEYLKLLADDIDPIEHKLEKKRIHTEKSKNTLEAVTS